MIDLTGQRFGRLVVLHKGPSRQVGKYKQRPWVCQCDCGKQTEVLTTNLKRRYGQSTQSCGCLQVDKRIDLAGQRFCHYLVLHEVEKHCDQRHWLCRCDCGNERKVLHYNLTLGKSTNCGCESAKKLGERSMTHGHTRGSSWTPEYLTWKGIRARCECSYLPSFPNYGGRGITVCERWQDATLFLADMGPRPSPHHSIERIDNDGPYSPDNCRWATPTEQARNTSRTIRVTYHGRTRAARDWEDELGLPPGIVRQRLKLGWSVEKALTTPPQKRKR